MSNGNQEHTRPPDVRDDPPPPESIPLTASDPDAPAVPRRPGDPDIPNDPSGRARHPGLAPWLWAVTLLGVGTALLGMPDASLLVALAGLCISAQGADLDLAWRRIYHLVSWMVPFSGMLVFGMVAYMLYERTDLTPGVRVALVGFAGAGAVLSMLTGLRPVSNALIAVLFPREAPSHTLRLAGRLVMMVLLFALPGSVAFRDFVATILESPEQYVTTPSLVGQLLGQVLLAFAAVGWQVRRTWRATCERLGLEALRPAHVGVVVLGVAALWGLNAGLEWLERAWFPALWTHDQAFGEALAGTLSPGQFVLLGLAAGIGEEIALRGAVQPRLGILLTAALFAALHIQYSWFGMLVILIIGVLLGWIRRRTNTTVAMAVHALYDMAALAAALQSGP